MDTIHGIVTAFDYELSSKIKLGPQSNFSSGYSVLFSSDGGPINKTLVAIAIVKIALLSMIFNNQEEEYLRLFEVNLKGWSLKLRTRT